MIDYPYHFARLEGRIMRDLYRAAFPLISLRKMEPTRKIEIDVCTY